MNPAGRGAVQLPEPSIAVTCPLIQSRTMLLTAIWPCLSAVARSHGALSDGDSSTGFTSTTHWTGGRDKNRDVQNAPPLRPIEAPLYFYNIGAPADFGSAGEERISYA
jgi:hypothetical protein